MSHDFKVGEVLHGFQGGAFGRDSYECRRIEAVGADWIVTRTLTFSQNSVELVTGDSLQWLQRDAECLEHEGWTP